MKKSLMLSGILMSLFVFVACSQKKLSERDKKLQEQQQKIDVKKSELEPLIGVYYGKLIGDQDYQQNIKLTLDIKEIPEFDGQADPILVPKLVGSLRFLYGSEEAIEYIDSAIKSAEFIKSSNQLSLVVTHQQFNEMVLSGKFGGSEIRGEWNAATLGVRGTFHVDKNQKPASTDLLKSAKPLEEN